ncbi:FHA domain-containing protein [Paenibacillus sp.]|uniref:FHA domain-containing protein n=1 Tax=Paenibacillus sp. TaxID=58172 RepID=UPI0028110DD4|nr:FHA domain-containing protein [Paenibacillus sp.]
MAVWEEVGLRANIDPDKGTEIVVCGRDGLKPDQTIRMQIGMLERNALAGTIALRQETRDGVVSFRYSVAGHRRLRTALRAESLREEQWDGLLAAMLLSIREGADYCIRETEYMLDPDWIWVRRDVRDVRFMAVPVAGIGSPERSWKQWKNVFVFFVECGLPDRWRDRLRPTRWDPATFSHRLWMDEVSGGPEEPGALAPSQALRTEGIESDSDNRYRVKPPVDIRENSVIGQAIREADDGETMRFSPSRMTSREWVRLLAATVCCIVFVWNPSLPTLVIACLGCVPLGITLYRRYVREKEAEDSGETGSTIPEASFVPVAAAADGTRKEPDPLEPDRLEHRTVLLADAQQTALLSDLKPERSASLEISFESGDRVETISLGGGPLRFGRGPEGVDVLVDHAAASRVHMVFDYTDGRLGACDLGSTNGTYYMDRLMTPHERYELLDGDLLRLPGAVIRVITIEGMR